ncbi:MAG: sulfurtransferase TusA family protein [Actinobacteria bacterium]|nr:sulfurtransferase TusA family protein [Actinomycetota bacterium]
MSTRPDGSVDALGTWCPVPVTLAREAIARMARGEVLEVLADDPMVFLDLPAWCHDAGHEVLSMEQRRDVITSLIRVR